RVVRGRPWVRVKLACSLDGRTAMASGDSKWITGEAARADVMHWRARAGAILTGAGTVLADDPSLTVRFATPREFVPPLRVVLDPGLATVARGKVREGDAPTLYLHAPDAKPPRELTADRAPVPVRAGVFDLPAVLALLAGRGINEVHVEAGATLAGALLKAGLVDELLLYVAPVLLGDTARPLFGGLGFTEMAQRLHMEIVETRRIGQDIRVLLRPAAAGALPAACRNRPRGLVARRAQKARGGLHDRLGHHRLRRRHRGQERARAAASQGLGAGRGDAARRGEGAGLRPPSRRAALVRRRGRADPRSA